VASKASRIDIACTRCSRRGRYQLARLVEQFGGDYALPDLGSELANCPNRNAAAHGERCDVYFPGLAAILSGD
jgi:hypothetical protein